MPSLAPLVRRGLTLAVAIVLTGCAAMSEEECRTANWNEQGVRDAMAGHSRARLEDLREACSKAKVTPAIRGPRCSARLKATAHHSVR